jgi:glycosyltransferase involved in cell wall biosynthesis
VAVLHVLEAIRGGTSRHLVDVVRSTSGVAHHVAVPQSGRAADESGAVVDEAALDALVDAGAVLHPVEMRRAPVHPANLGAAWALRRLIRTIRPGVVHGHSSVGGALARIAAAGSCTPVFYTPNGVSPARMSLALERMLGRLTDTLIAVSPSEAKLATEQKLVRPERVVVVPNGIDVDPPRSEVDIRTLAGIPEGAPVVGTVARLVPQKAPTLFVRVCAEVARTCLDVHFLLIGLGPLQGAVDEAVAAAGLSRRWHQIPHLPDAAAILGQFDVFALLSAFEGGPYTPLEAMRAGTPVVLTNVVGNHDVVEAGVSGVVAPFGDVAALAAAVTGLITDPEHRRSVGQAGRRRVEEQFDARLMGARLEELYREAVRDGHCPPNPAERD